MVKFGQENTGIAFYPRPCYNDSATKSLSTERGTFYVPPIGLSVLAFRSEKKVPAREGAVLFAGRAEEYTLWHGSENTYVG